jgi:hypothetical protein
MQNPEEFINSLPEIECEIATILHHEISAITGVSCKTRFKLPFYDYQKWLCYLSPQKKGGIELCFINGLQLDPEQVYLDAKKRSMISGLTIKNKKDLDLTLVKALVLEAIQFEKTQNKKQAPTRKANRKK